jgi:hypothetical protein
MPKTAKAKLDQTGLTKLGLEKLVEILLDEAAFNKPLKSRLQAALAGESGALEVARLIDKKLESLSKSRAYLSPTRANTLSVELRGLLKNITSELAALDKFAAFHRVLNFLAVGEVIEERARKGGARLAKVLEDARIELAEVVLSLDTADQVHAVPLLEKLRIKDDEAKCRAALLDILCGMHPTAADAWKTMLAARLKSTTEKAAHWRNAEPIAYLQRLAAHRADVDGYIALELLKPQERRDSQLIARMLHAASRSEEALEWARKPAASIRVTDVQPGALEDVQSPRLLEAAILDALKRRDEAQAIRWQEFEHTLSPDILRDYIAKLDDFAEFDEMDRALALVAASERIHEALDFLILWPRLDLASEQVLRHVGRWDGRRSGILARAADALAKDYPAAATMLYRAVIEDVLKRGLSEDYLDGVGHLVMLYELQSRLDRDFPHQAHRAFVAGLRARHDRKFAFWQLVPRDLL